MLGNGNGADQCSLVGLRRSWVSRVLGDCVAAQLVHLTVSFAKLLLLDLRQGAKHPVELSRIAHPLLHVDEADSKSRVHLVSLLLLLKTFKKISFVLFVCHRGTLPQSV